MPGPLDSGDVVDLSMGGVERPADHTGFFANVKAGYNAARAGPGSTNSRQNAFETKYYDQAIKALTAEGEMGADKIDVRPGGWGYTGPKNIPVNQFGIGQVDAPRPFRNPYSGTSITDPNFNPIRDFTAGGNQTEAQAIFDAIKRVQARKPGFLKGLDSPDAIAARALADRNQLSAQSDAVTSKAGTLGTIGGFVGGLAGGIASGDPENFVGIGLETAAAKTVARTVVKRALQEGAINAVAGGLALPTISTDAHHLGTDMTPGDMAKSVLEQGALGGVFGGAHVAVPHILSGAKDIAGKVAGTVAANLPAPIRDPLVAASIRAGTVKDRDMLREWQKMHNPYSVVDTSTPDERAAAHVISRDADVAEASPLHPAAAGANDHRLDAIAASLGVGLAPPSVPTTAPIQMPSVPDRSANAPTPRRPASLVEAIGHAEGTARNPNSSAVGGGQFLKKTWLALAPRLTDTSGMSEPQILALRSNKGLTDRAIQLYGDDNGRYLHARGFEDSPGNRSLAHFLGPEGADRLLKADPSAPVESLLKPEAIAANRQVLAGKSADEVIQWAHKRIGATVDHAPARADAVNEYDPIQDGVPPEDISYATFRPDEVTTDAPLMQYKGGGDANGVTDALKGVEAWNPILSQQILAYERLDGSRVVVDGHQRAGLAKRLYENDPSIRLPAIVIREEDGITPAHARVIGAMRNIANGTGTLLDNAKVLRDAPGAAAQLAPNGPNARDIRGLAALSYEAFGAAVNEVVDPHIAAQVGLHSAPDTHMAMIDLLHRNRVTKASEAGHIVRQAQADGFGSAQEHQMSMFGDTPAQSLYVPIARILDAAGKRLRDEKRTFKVLSDKAGRIERAGNVLDRTANQGKVVSSDEALAILNATAHRSGPVRDALIEAARAELHGTRRADAVGGFLDKLGAIDLRAAAAGVEQGGRVGAMDERPGYGIPAEAADGELSASDGPSLFDQAVSAKSQSEGFSDPVGPAAKEQTMLLEHDLRPDPNIVETDKQKTRLKASSPMQAVAEQQGTMGLSLFDSVDQPTFRLSDEGDTRSLPDIMAETQADETAAQAARDCLL